MTYGPRRTTPPIDRILRNCAESESGCWLWQGHTSADGYFTVNLGRRNEGRALGHRVTYEFFRGEIPVGLVLDHLCRVPRCVNPWHLDPVTNRENTVRGDAMRNGQHNASKTECAQGHEFNQRNTYFDKRGHRHCAECNRIKSRNYQRDLRARKAAA